MSAPELACWSQQNPKFSKTRKAVTLPQGLLRLLVPLFLLAAPLSLASVIEVPLLPKLQP